MNKQQKERYSRHLMLKELGETGQQKLLDARVLVVGAGGLGAPVLHYLAAAGVGTIGIVDGDVVSLSNLQRQVLYTVDDIGVSKAFLAAKKLSRLNPDVVFDVHEEMLTAKNAERLIAKYDIVVGASDNFASRYLIDNVTCAQNKPFVHASVGAFEGQVAVFNYQGSLAYQDLFAGMCDDDTVLGVVGVLPGIVGSLQANEVVKIICGLGDVLANKLLIYDSLTCEMQVVKMGRS